MAPTGTKRRRGEEEVRRPKKKMIKHFKKQKEYHSGSESDTEEPRAPMDGVNATPIATERLVKKGAMELPAVAAESELLVEEIEQEPESEAEATGEDIQEAVDAVGGVELEDDDVEEDDNDDEDEEEEEEDSDAIVLDLADLEHEEEDGNDDELATDASSASESEASDVGGTERKKKKRNDPTAFANSISKILSSKLSTSKRSDPVLSRSAAASAASRELNDAKLEAKAKRKLHAEKRAALEKGRVRDVLGLETAEVSTAEIQELEKRLKKTAQRGVVKLFNAVRASQVKGQMARDQVTKEGVVGMAQRDERVTEMSKKGFLDLIAHGGKKAPAMNIQEA